MAVWSDMYEVCRMQSCFVGGSVPSVVGRLEFLPLPIIGATRMVDWTNSALHGFHNLEIKLAPLSP